ncbi:MAG: ATP/GTP-binding protein [Mariprofundaceae bacterium]|nr:ATP/GTP-binding protein [Mariprofundaceae bacterium]
MARKEIAKILITGPFNAGKTTLIRHISDEQSSGKDVQATDALAQFKGMTTVGLDFGILHVDDTLDVHLFGTPGQSRFNFMWRILSKGALGTIFLIDSSSQRAIDEGKGMFQYYRERSDDPIIIGATKRDEPGAKAIDVLVQELNVGDTTVIPCDPRKVEDSKTLVLSLLQAIIDAQTGGVADDDDYDDLMDLE